MSERLQLFQLPMVTMETGSIDRRRVLLMWPILEAVRSWERRGGALRDKIQSCSLGGRRGGMNAVSSATT